MKRVFGIVEAIFDILYLCVAVALGCVLLFTGQATTIRMLAGIMAFTLAGGDAFHLIPRVFSIFSGKTDALNRALGRGKQITSITMTIYYLFLWHIGLLMLPGDLPFLLTVVVYVLAVVRILLCLFPQNKWEDRYPPICWAVYRNIPFFLLGITVSFLFLFNNAYMSGLSFMWLAILLSFAFYLPVVLWSNKNPRIGMLMLPKTCIYVWMFFMCLSL